MGKRGEGEGRGGEGMYRSAPPFSNPGYATAYVKLLMRCLTVVSVYKVVTDCLSVSCIVLLLSSRLSFWH
jgi:hypothetical protein